MSEANIPLLGQQKEEPKFPLFQIAVAPQGILIECFFSPVISIKFVLDEQSVNAMFAEWIKSRKDIQATQMLVRDMMESKKKGFN